MSTTPRLTIPFRDLSDMQIRSRMRGELRDDPAALERWKKYTDEYREIEATYASASVRGFQKGEKTTNAVK